MDRDLWQRSWLSQTHCPPWRCPVCKKGIISLRNDSLVYEETALSKQGWEQDWWDPEYTDYVFTAWGECNHSSCKQTFAISGTGGLTDDHDGDDSRVLVQYFEPLHCSPMPEIIAFSEKCPDEVVQELHAAFRLFWVSPDACAARIRVSLECLMDNLKIPRQQNNKNNKPYDLNLHQRIEIFEKENPAIGAQLMAIKWLGNTGSHEADISKSDVLNGFEILEYALEELFSGRSERVMLLAEKLVKKHKPKK